MSPMRRLRGYLNNVVVRFQHHAITIRPRLWTPLSNSHLYLLSRQFPDKAIDILTRVYMG